MVAGWIQTGRRRRRIGRIAPVRGAALLALIVLCGAPGPGAARTAGPSFACAPVPLDAMSRLTCGDDALARAEMHAIQTYYTLRQVVGLPGQPALKAEILSFLANTRRRCGLPPLEPNRDQSRVPLPGSAAACVTAAYDAQRTAWATSLSGAAAQEAARAPEQTIALQGRLQALGFIGRDAPVDGVFGAGTRTAILAWQRAKARPETGFLSDADAAALLGAASTAPSASPPADPPDPYAQWRVPPLAEAAFQGTPVSIGVKGLQASLAIESGPAGGPCAVPDGGLLSLTEASDDDKNSCRAVVVRVAVDGQTVTSGTAAVLGKDTDPASLLIRMAIRRLDPATPLPQVVLTGYSGGAHCCTATSVATAGPDGAWRFVSLGRMDGDEGFQFLDLAGDGTSLLVDTDGGFLYAFSSYAGSYAPTRIQRFTGGRLETVTRAPQFRDLLRHDLRGMQDNARTYGMGEPNGYLAGWVAQKILVGELLDGWRGMLSRYDRKADEGLTVCAVDRRVWTKGVDGEPLSCPDGQEIRVTYPAALARHLFTLGYLTAEQSAALGFDPAVLEAATQRYADRMMSGWFVVNRAGACVPPPGPSSPADMITADRARGTEDDVSVLEPGADGKPAVVRVDTPRGNGLASSVVFYRGMARCERARQQHRKALDDLR